MRKEKLTKAAILLLKSLIKTPSFSSEEEQTALLIESWFKDSNITFNRTNNNIWATNKYFDETKPTLLLISHHDTVKPTKGYTKDPFDPIINAGKLKKVLGEPPKMIAVATNTKAPTIPTIVAKSIDFRTGVIWIEPSSAISLPQNFLF